jgi:thioredoxin 1
MGNKPFEVTDATFQQEVLKSDQPVLVDFWAEWCGPCKMIAPIVEQIANEYAGKLRVGKVDTDVNAEYAMQYGIMSIPTLLLFKDGQLAERITGYMPKERILAKLTPHLD